MTLSAQFVGKAEMFDDYYQILGVNRDASQDEIKKAYYTLARDSHPDLHPDDPDAKKKFHRVQVAFRVLNDPQEREKYNRIFDSYFRNPPPPPIVDPPAPATGPARSSTSAVTRPVQSRQKRAATEVLKIIIGGIVGISMALLLIPFLKNDGRQTGLVAQPSPRKVYSSPPQIESVVDSMPSAAEKTRNPADAIFGEVVLPKSRSSPNDTEDSSSPPPQTVDSKQSTAEKTRNPLDSIFGEVAPLDSTPHPTTLWVAVPRKRREPVRNHPRRRSHPEKHVGQRTNPIMSRKPSGILFPTQLAI